ncbi:hypothetical protein TNCV_796811 [Trichonephila clavipes]|uniref:Uncharacterized protein n=1 Tax=Trichonephila clavipes TaxID=2585209 RepID=A0A8X7BM68_TRICX|nr:hypothetical protein TNCV_796811 [Trichonephila clavipes]
MSPSGGQSEARSPVFESPNKLGTHLSSHCSRDERLSRPCQEYQVDRKYSKSFCTTCQVDRKQNPDL